MRIPLACVTVAPARASRPRRFLGASLALACITACDPIITPLQEDMAGADISGTPDLAGSDIVVPPGCTDGTRSGDETDVDCGGSCAPCAAGKKCADDTDCQTGMCVVVCVAQVSCSNGTKDGFETDIDCGGGQCPKCAAGRSCAVSSDCASNLCTAGQCQPPKTNVLSFAAPVTLAQVTDVLTIAAGDVDGDGRSDVLAVLYNANAARLLRGAGNGTLTAGAALPTGGRPQYARIADLNKDGRGDALVGTFSPGLTDGVVNVLLGGAGGVASNTPVAANRCPMATAVADFTGDGKLDVVTVNCDAGTVTVLRGGGDGTFVKGASSPAGMNPQYVEAGDWNGDGRIDAAVANGTGQATILLGKGDGTFASAGSYELGPSPQALAAADLDKDGRLDLVVADALGYGLTVLRSQGNGDFTVGNTYVVGQSQGLYGVVAADLDLDGKPDLASTDKSGGRLVVFTGNGDATFQSGVGFPSGGSPAHLAAADFNGDGKLDIAVANPQQASVSILINTSK